MPREATSGARSSLGESRVPRDAAALVAAAARLRGALSDAEAARVGTAEILALLRAPRDADAPSPRRLRARCGWALDHGVVDALVEAMRAHADCVPLQTLAATCLADVAEAFVDEHEAVETRDFSAKNDARDENETRNPFDSPSGVVTNADLCVDAFHALAMRRHERHLRGAVSDCMDERVRSDPGFDPGSFGETDELLVCLAEANTRHAPFFRDEDSFATRRALVSRATTRFVRPHGTFRVETGDDDDDDAEKQKQNDRPVWNRTLVLRGDVVFAATRETSDETSDVDETTRFSSRAREGRNPNPNPKTTPLETPLLSEEGPSSDDLRLFPERQTRSRRFVAGDALDPGSNPGANRSGAARVFRAGAEGCVLVTAPVWPLEARAVADAVDEGLRGFFGAAEEEEEEEEEEEGFGAEREALRDAGQKKQTFIDGVEDEFHSSRVEKSALLATLFEQKNHHGVSSRRFWCSPHARLARDGAADAVLHVALRCAGAGARLDTAYADEDDGTRSSRARLASACFSFLENLASPPCDVSVLKSLGADGAMDRVVATKAAFSCEAKSEADEDRETQRALACADRALRALARCEQNMRAAFSLGAAEIVW